MTRVPVAYFCRLMRRFPQPGDEIELLVVSDEPQLQRSRAVREAYLPELGMWISEYPFMERLAYRSISDAIAAERERRTAL